MKPPIYIAVVDDHTAFRKGFCLLIGLLGDYSVLFDAASARDCIQQLSADRLPDIILVDIVMPDLDGVGLVGWLGAHYPGVRVLALSALDQEAVVIRMFGAGARGFIRKDIETDALRQAFADVMEYGYFLGDFAMDAADRSGNAAARVGGLQELSKEERLFLRAVSAGKSDAAIALEWGVSVGEIEGWRDHLFEKLSLTTRAALALYAYCHGITE